jgi:hypothetical protein
MPIDFQKRQVIFGPSRGQTQHQELLFTFTSNVSRAEAEVIGYNIGFTNQDRALFRLQANANVISGINTPAVQVGVDYGLRDNTGTFDDNFDGVVDVMLIVDRA